MLFHVSHIHPMSSASVETKPLECALLAKLCNKVVQHCTLKLNEMPLLANFALNRLFFVCNISLDHFVHHVRLSVLKSVVLLWLSGSGGKHKEKFPKGK